MKAQTRFYIRRGKVVGLIMNGRHKQWKHCKWCGHTFLPSHNKQAYCDPTCKTVSRQNYKNRWMYTWRIKVRHGEILNDRSILNVGTGGLGEHRCSVDGVEHRKILKEMRELGLR